MSDQRTQAFGIDFFTGTKEELLAAIDQDMHRPYSYIVTPNIDHVVQLQSNPDMRESYKRAGKRICDSRILLPILKSLGVSIPEVITGSDLTLSVLRKANDQRLSVVLIGASDTDVGKLRRMYPHMQLEHYNPPMGFINDPVETQKCVDFVLQHPSEFVLYAVGAPRQEKLARQIDSSQRTGVGLCIGASILFAVGTVKRAPQWMQKARLEWLHRMCSEPKRLAKRYVHDALSILPIYLKERSSRRT